MRLAVNVTRYRAALGWVDCSGARIGGRGLGTEIGPGLQIIERIYDAAAGTVRSTGPQGSGILLSMSLANCLIDLPESLSGAQPGDTVGVEIRA